MIVNAGKYKNELGVIINVPENLGNAVTVKFKNGNKAIISWVDIKLKPKTKSDLTEAGVKDILSKLNPKNYKYQNPKNKDEESSEKPSEEPIETSNKDSNEESNEMGSEIENLQKQATEAYIDNKDKRAQNIMKPYFKNFIGKNTGNVKIKEILIGLRKNDTPFYTIKGTMGNIPIIYVYVVDNDKLMGELAGQSITDDNRDKTLIPNVSTAKLLSDFISKLRPDSKYTNDSDNFVLLGDSTEGDDKWEEIVNRYNKRRER